MKKFFFFILAISLAACSAKMNEVKTTLGDVIYITQSGYTVANNDTVCAIYNTDNEPINSFPFTAIKGVEAGDNLYLLSDSTLWRYNITDNKLDEIVLPVGEQICDIAPISSMLFCLSKKHIYVVDNELYTQLYCDFVDGLSLTYFNEALYLLSENELWRITDFSAPVAEKICDTQGVRSIVADEKKLYGLSNEPLIYRNGIFAQLVKKPHQISESSRLFISKNRLYITDNILYRIK